MSTVSVAGVVSFVCFLCNDGFNVALKNVKNGLVQQPSQQPSPEGFHNPWTGV